MFRNWRGLDEEIASCLHWIFKLWEALLCVCFFYQQEALLCNKVEFDCFVKGGWNYLVLYTSLLQCPQLRAERHILWHFLIEIQISISVTMWMRQQLFYFNPWTGATRAFFYSVTANRLNFCHKHAINWPMVWESWFPTNIR